MPDICTETDCCYYDNSEKGGCKLMIPEEKYDKYEQCCFIHKDTPGEYCKQCKYKYVKSKEICCDCFDDPCREGFSMMPEYKEILKLKKKIYKYESLKI